MSIDLEKRIERLEAIQDRVFAKLDEMHVEFVTLSSKVGNGLTASTRHHASEIEKIKTAHKKLSEDLTLRCKDFEVDHVRVSAKIDILENNLLKDLDQIKRGIGHGNQIRRKRLYRSHAQTPRRRTSGTGKDRQ